MQMIHCGSMACCVTVSHGGMTLLSQGRHDSTVFIRLLRHMHFISHVITLRFLLMYHNTLFIAVECCSGTGRLSNFTCMVMEFCCGAFPKCIDCECKQARPYQCRAHVCIQGHFKPD